MAKTSDEAKVPAPPDGSVRKARARPRAPSDPIRAFLLGVSLPTVAVYIAICALVLLTLQVMTGEINRIDSDRGQKAVNAAIGSIVAQLGDEIVDEASGTEAYLNTYVDFNAAWLDGAWGITARSDSNYDTAIVTDAEGRIIFGESSDGPLSGNIADHYRSAAALTAILGEKIARIGDGAMITQLARTEDGIAGIAASVVHSATGTASIPEHERRILWFARSINDTTLAVVARSFQIPIPHLVLDGDAEPDEDTFALLDAANEPIGVLAWRPLRPGDAAFMHITSITSLVLFVVGILILVVLTAFRHTVERRAEAEERDWLSARFDASTGLLNRFGLEESIRQMVPRLGELSVAIGFIEFEGVKDVAGSYGQEKAEALLNKLADLIDVGIEGQAQLARLGPDEFVIARTGDDALPLVRQFARTVLDIVAEAIPLDDLRLKLAASVGVAEAKVTRKNANDPINRATAAVQRARETGGNHIVEYDASLEVSRRDRLAMQADIRRGLNADEFDLVYQPIFDFGTQAMLGVEALLRWPRRAGGPMGPADFIPAAEASGLIEELGLFVLHKACEDLRPFQGLKASVNVSTVQFRSPALLTRIDSILSETGFPSSRLQLEITESFLLAHPERAKDTIEGLRRRGIAIALDDFGTGFSSIGYLRQFSFDRVKLDRSLVDGIDFDPVKMALVESTMVFAFAMGLKVTAEGVERREEAAALTRLGCREYQGYLFSKPVTLDALKRLHAESQQLKKTG